MVINIFFVIKWLFGLSFVLCKISSTTYNEIWPKSENDKLQLENLDWAFHCFSQQNKLLLCKRSTTLSKSITPTPATPSLTNKEE